MANISNFSARSGRMVKEDGTVVNIADLLAGDAEAVSESTYNIDSFSAMSGRMIREDGSVINIADEIANGNIGGGGGTPEQIQQAVDAYLEENPVQPGATVEQVAQIEKNKTDISELSEEKIDYGIYTYNSNDESIFLYKDYYIESPSGNLVKTNSVQKFLLVKVKIKDYDTIEFIGRNLAMLSSSVATYAIYDYFDKVINIVKVRNKNEIQTLRIPDNADYIIITFSYSEDSEDYGREITLKSLNRTYIGLEKEIDEKIANKLIYHNGKVGELDNVFVDRWIGVGTYTSYNGGTKNGSNRVYTNKVCNGVEIRSNYYTSINDVMNTEGTAFLRIKKSKDHKTFYNLKNSAGANANFDDDSYGDIRQVNVGTLMGKIIRNTDAYILISFPIRNQPVTVTSYLDSYKVEPTELLLDTDHCAAFLESLDYEDIDYDISYKSRSQKYNLNIRGKNAIVFADSLVGWALPLSTDFGMNLYVVGGGGCRMGYESGSGAGGESGTANELWLCNSERINAINNIMQNVERIDYIINGTGTNGSFSDVSNKEELQFVLNNKKWWFDTTSTDNWDSLSEENKKRFTSPACYIASFIKIIEHYHYAVPVICNLYRYKNAVDEERALDQIYGTSNMSKNTVLNNLSDMLGGYFVDFSKCGANFMSNGDDAVHPEYRYSIMAASEIAKAIDHSPYNGDLI